MDDFIFDNSEIHFFQEGGQLSVIADHKGCRKINRLLPVKFEFKDKVCIGKFFFIKFSKIYEIKISEVVINESIIVNNSVCSIEKNADYYYLYIDLTKIAPINKTNIVNFKINIEGKKGFSVLSSFTRNYIWDFDLELPVSYEDLDGFMVFAKLNNGKFKRCFNGSNFYLYSHDRLSESKCQIALVNYLAGNKGQAYVTGILNKVDREKITPSDLNVELLPDENHKAIIEFGNYGLKGDIDFSKRDRIRQDFILLDVKMDLENYNKLNVIKFPLKFNYSLGSQTGVEFESNIFIQEEGLSSWVTIDVGTSAISGVVDDTSINLHQGLKRLKKEEYQEGGFLEKAPLLSSVALLKDEGMVLSTSYNNSLVQVSPSINEISEYAPYLLPPLKMLVGTKYLENSRGTYNISYKYSSENNTFRQVSEEKHWLKVEDLLVSFFYALFRDFIQQDDYIREQIALAKFNKIVFTTPNSFSIYERETIRKILVSNFEFLKQIVFLSESDACACFYLKNWIVMNNRWGRSDGEINKLRPKNGDVGVEHVLIYDMGAGTLDITYLKVTSEGRDIYVEILGNFSSTSAGNYADYVISEALINTYNKELIDVFDNNKTAIAYQKNRFRVKNFVKNELKPLLGLSIEKKQLEFSVLLNETETTINLNLPLKKNSKINDAIYNFNRLNSSDVFGHFFSLHGNGQNIVDTMIFAGRATQLCGLKEELKRSIYDFSSSTNIKFMDLEEQNLKLAPAKGAFYFAGTYLKTELYKGCKNINARFGFVVKNSRGDWEFVDFLNPQTASSNQNFLDKEGVRVYEYDILGEINVTHSNEFIFFVKSYSQFTSEDFTKDGYVSIIYKFQKDDALILRDAEGRQTHHPSNLPIRITVDSDNVMLVKVGGRTLEEIDRPEGGFVINETFKKSIWPHYL